MMGTTRPVAILGMGVYIPEKVMTNKDFEAIVDTSDEWITTRTGIRERHFAAPEQATSDLAVNAARRALEDAGKTADDIGLVIVATVIPDMPFPSTASAVQHELGCKHAAAFDVEAACSGFIYGLSIAQQFVATGTYENVLVIGAETLSRIINFNDRSTCVLLGDGAGAVVVGPAAPGKGILALRLGSDGSGKDVLKQPAGGSRMPASLESVQASQHSVFMVGNQVFKFAVKTLEQTVKQVLADVNLGTEDVSLFVPHQANLRIIEAVGDRLKIGKDKIAINIHKYGNMSAASIPVALYEAREEGRIKADDIVLLAAFGGGLTWGSVVIRW
jgi:3-oxoacyl-[acyl-carrier-protein] synthase III